nr:palindromic element RPE2 domain-containing protein [Rickettsia endosymbiont of Oedothorax gibbosus]
MVNSGEFGARSNGATPISNRRATSDDVPNFSSIDYSRLFEGNLNISESQHLSLNAKFVIYGRVNLSTKKIKK